MMLAIAIATVPVVLGVFIALVPNLNPDSANRAGPIFAVLAILIAVMQLLPAAVDELGLTAVVFAVACFAAAGIIERLTRGPQSLLGLGVTIIGFVTHQIADGVQIGIAAKLDLNLWTMGSAFALHTIPLTAVITQALSVRVGNRAALTAGAVILLASGAAVPTGSVMTGLFPQGSEAWIQALIAGLLLHTIWHQHSLSPSNNLS